MADVATYPDPVKRALITISALTAVLMVTIDSTIAVIALPRIQSSLAASPEQITWVLTSYMIAGAIATPLSGWLADRFGRGQVMATSVLFFTLSSVGCGLSPNLETLVVFRFIQGWSGAAILPLTQVLLMDINPPEKHGPAIAVFSIGTLCGPMIGPTLGSWLTETVSWHAIFLINAPIGVVSVIGLATFVRDRPQKGKHPFDLSGFLAVSMALAAFQLMVDRGQMLDWFSSTEILIELCICAFFGYLAVVHMFTVKNPFIKPAIFLDRNFLIGTLLSAVIGILLNSIIPIMTTLMQNMLGYPVMLAGYLSLPRSIGNMVTILGVGFMMNRMDARIPIVAGMLMLVWSMYLLSTLSLDSRPETFAWITFLQGCGAGLLFMPLMLVVFSTLPVHMRNEGSTLFALTRAVAGSAGLSLIQAMTIRDAAQVQSRLVEHVRTDNPVLGWRVPDFDPADVQAVGGMMGEIARQAEMVAYIDGFRLILLLSIVLTPFCFLLRTNVLPRERGSGTPIHVE